MTNLSLHMLVVGMFKSLAEGVSKILESAGVHWLILNNSLNMAEIIRQCAVIVCMVVYSLCLRV